jgi:hypothetical protein
MSVVAPSDAVLDIMRSASGTVIVVAPYIKSSTLRALLAALPAAISELTCITRWLPEDIASGVCDIEIFEDVKGHRGGKLLVQPHLHAKYYRAGDQCLVGSANLTGRGLGWVTPANVELLVRLPADFAGLRGWEAALLNSAIPATEQLRDQILREAERLKAAGALPRAPEVDQGSEAETAASLWIPGCPVPERLWSVYTGGGADTMVSSAREAAHRDLAALAPPNGLTQAVFVAYVAGILRQMPLMAEIDSLAVAGITDSQAHEFLSGRLGAEPLYPIDQSWRVLKAWLIHFFPETYRLETGQEVLVKGRKLPS